jgi:Ser/Thr protein kinase RdoA (MazF antagonist)
MSSIWGNAETKFFFELGPDEILQAVDSLGLRTTGRVLQLNSMENRVYEVEIESKSENPSEHFKIVKFYRPNRWTKEQILEEHEFLLDLEEYEIPVIPPSKFQEQTLFEDKKLNLFFTLFRKQGGRSPEEFNTEELEQLGRLMARVHNVGAMKKANHRISLNPETFVINNLNFLLDQKKIPPHFENTFKLTLEEIYKKTKESFKNINYIRVHGDCHLGNVIKRDDIFHLVDFDDFMMGPAIQDLWLLIPGRDEYAINQRNILLNEYQTVRDLNFEELGLIETLRTYRMINFTAWIAKRYDDPAFKNAFPFFESPTYWDEKINDFREQLYYL